MHFSHPSLFSIAVECGNRLVLKQCTKTILKLWSLHIRSAHFRAFSYVAAFNDWSFQKLTKKKQHYIVLKWKRLCSGWYQIPEQTFHEVIFTYRKSIKMWQKRLRALWQISLVCTQYRHSNAITLKLQWIFNNPMTNYSTRVFKIMWCPYLLEQVHSGIN